MSRAPHAIPGVLAAVVWFAIAQVWPRPLSFTWQAYWPGDYLILAPRRHRGCVGVGAASGLAEGSVAAAGLTVAVMWLLVGASIGSDMESTLYDPQFLFRTAEVHVMPLHAAEHPCPPIWAPLRALPQLFWPCQQRLLVENAARIEAAALLGSPGE